VGTGKIVWDAYEVIFVDTHSGHVCKGGECHTVVGAGGSSLGLLLNSTTTGMDLVRIEYGEQSLERSVHALDPVR
jgi:hypothetical protein